MLCLAAGIVVASENLASTKSLSFHKRLNVRLERLALAAFKQTASVLKLAQRVVFDLGKHLQNGLDAAKLLGSCFPNHESHLLRIHVEDFVESLAKGHGNLSCLTAYSYSVLS